MNKDQVHEKLAKLGLERIEYTERAMYKLVIVDELSNASYPLILTTHSCEQGDTIVKFEEADFQGGDAIPRSIRNAALSKLFELEQIFQQDSQSKELSETNNGSMAPTQDEMKKLGDDMKNMKTNSELVEANLVPDPIQ